MLLLLLYAVEPHEVESLRSGDSTRKSEIKQTVFIYNTQIFYLQKKKKMLLIFIISRSIDLLLMSGDDLSARYNFSATTQFFFFF